MLINVEQAMLKGFEAALEKGVAVKRVVNLSTIGRHLEKGSGILLGAHHVEEY